MSARLLDGRALAGRLRADVARRASGLPFRPGLAVVLVGEDPASAVYVRNKDRAATGAGLDVRTERLPAGTDQATLLRLVRALNDDPDVDGILLQLPLPAHLDAAAVLATIDPAKDVDGLTPTSAGLLAAGRPGLLPCTPRGVMLLLAEAGVELAGARAVVIGRSVLVGRPAAALLCAADATVTLAHSRTRDLAAECRRAEVVVAAAGRAEMVRGDWIAPGAVVIDVGINRGADGRLVGDARFDECAAVAGAITPVPGGVGPMTIACLVENTLLAAVARRADQGLRP